MRTIVHLSDLHFGRVDHRMLAPLMIAVANAEPHLVVVSGDFTQRARTKEFKDAAGFLSKLPHPQLCVPGNHDVPLYDFLRRCFSPLARYRRYIADDLAPIFIDEEIAVLGINTARALTFKNGRIGREQLVEVRKKFSQCSSGITRIVVTHHPFDIPNLASDDKTRYKVINQAPLAISAFHQARVDMILSGHLHHSHIGRTIERYPTHGRSALMIKAGTACSTRQRGHINSFNIVRISRRFAMVTCMIWEQEHLQFCEGNTAEFFENADGWTQTSAI